jgi:WD40 domain-containing protein
LPARRTGGRLRRLAPDGRAAKVANLNASVAALAATGGAGWACVAGGRVHGDLSPPPGVGDLAGATGLAWHPAAGLAVAHPGGVALCRGPAIVEPLPGEAPAVAAVAFSPDGCWLAGGPALWRLSPPAPPAPVALPAPPRPPVAIAFSAGGDLLALAGPEGVRLWRLAADGASAVTGARHPRGQAATALAFHPRRPLLAAGYANGAVLLGPPDGDGAVLLRAASGMGGVGALAFAADGAWLAIGSAEGECALVALPDLLFRPGGARPAAGTVGGAP